VAGGESIIRLYLVPYLGTPVLRIALAAIREGVIEMNPAKWVEMPPLVWPKRLV
jgi:hypothetical protein